MPPELSRILSERGIDPNSLAEPDPGIIVSAYGPDGGAEATQAVIGLPPEFE